MLTARRHLWLIFSMAAILLAAFAPSALAQGVRLEGIVKDASQAVIPGVTVTATNQGTSISTTSLTNETGLYVFVNLVPGTYTITCELQGFKRYINKDLVLQVGASVSINIVLETGELNTEVVVSAAAPLIDVTTNKVGNVVQERQVVDLPLNGRNPMMLFYLQAGTNPYDAVGTSQQAVGSVDGLRTNASNVKIEGVWASDASYDMSPASPNATVPLEAVGEYRVTTSSASADSGRGAGAQVTVVYKSGTNNFHGSVFEYNRNTAYNAGEFFANKNNKAKPKFIRNQYGASLGGPIFKNKTFFFATWEGQREIQGVVLNRYSYTQTMRDGIFRYYIGGKNATTVVDPATGNPLIPASSIGTIDALNIDPNRKGMDSSGRVAALFKAMPLPNNFELGDGFNLAGYRYVENDPNNYNQGVAKIDHTFNPKHQLSVSIGDYWRDSAGTLMYSGYWASNSIEKKRNIMIGLVSAFKSNLTNEARVGGTRRLTWGGPDDPAQYAHTGVYQLWGVISSGNRGSDPEGNLAPVYLPQRNPIDAYNISDSLSWVKKNHTFKFGFEVTHTTKNNWFGGDEYIPTAYTNQANGAPTYPTISGINSSDLARAKQFTNDLTGTITSINQTYNANSVENGFVPYDTRHRLLRQREWGMFFSDTWKVAQNLTVNYGTRWDILPLGWMANGIYSYPVGGSLAVLGISGPVGVYKTGLAPNDGKEIARLDLNNFGPNIGFTWDPTKAGKMSVSANYRIAYDRSMQSVYSRLEDQNIGMNVTSTVYPTGVKFSNIQSSPYWQTYQGAPALLLPVAQPFAPIPFTRQNRAYAMDENIATPYTQSWSLRVQREIGKDWYIQAAYVGNHAVGTWRARNFNQIEIRKNGFLNEFLAAQRNLAANGDPNKGEPLGNLGKLFAPASGGRIPSSFNTYIQQGQVGYLADQIDRVLLYTTKAGFPENYFRMNPQVQNANIIGNLSHSTWEGLKVDVGKRFSQGTYIQINYTLGKGLTDYTGGQTVTQDYRDNLNPQLDKGLQQYDSTHIMQSNVIWELPIGKNKKWMNSVAGWKDAFIGGWQINAIAQFVTSRPFTVSSQRQNLTVGNSTSDYSGTDFNLASQVIRTGGNIMAMTAEQIAMFKDPPAGSAGGTPFYAFRGPHMFNIDTSMFKNFRLPFMGEQGNLQFRAEAFNVLNHVNFQRPNGNVNGGSFGVISAGYSPRILQFALKLNF